MPKRIGGEGASFRPRRLSQEAFDRLDVRKRAPLVESGSSRIAAVGPAELEPDFDETGERPNARKLLKAQLGRADEYAFGNLDKGSFRQRRTANVSRHPLATAAGGGFFHQHMERREGNPFQPQGQCLDFRAGRSARRQDGNPLRAHARKRRRAFQTPEFQGRCMRQHDVHARRIARPRPPCFDYFHSV